MYLFHTKYKKNYLIVITFWEKLQPIGSEINNHNCYIHITLLKCKCIHTNYLITLNSTKKETALDSSLLNVLLILSIILEI